jgi:CheY-like chemotaxis protein
MSRVLIVDEDFRDRAFLHFILDEAGFSVKEAATGSEGFDLFMRDTEGIDLVILDDEQLETLSALRLVNPDVHCCVLTNDYPVESLRALGAVAGFAKPIIDSARFIRQVRQIARWSPQFSEEVQVPRPSPTYAPASRRTSAPLHYPGRLVQPRLT